MKIQVKYTLALILSSFMITTCFATGNVRQKKKRAKNKITFSSCSFEAGRLDVEWAPVFAYSKIKLNLQNAGKDLPEGYIAYLVNNLALASFMENLTNLPIDKRIMTLPVMGGQGCMEFQLLSATTSDSIQSEQHWQAVSIANKGYQASIDFKDGQLTAVISENGLEETLTSWPAENGAIYYLLYSTNLH